MSVIAAPEISWSVEFLTALHKLAPADSHRVIGALEQMARDPERPSLNLEKLSGRAKNFWSIRASKSLRVLLVRQGNVFFAVDVGTHDELYQRAKRSHFVVDPSRQIIRLVTVEPDVRARDGIGRATQTGQALAAANAERRPLDHWTDAELLQAGLDPTEVERVRLCAVDEDLLALALDDDRFERALDLLAITPQEHFAPTFDEEAAATERVRSAVGEFGALAGFTRLLSAEELARLAAAPIEDWMVFLHPDQQDIVSRRYDGPARVRGAAGTGKTVVALHRAAELGRRFEAEGEAGKILFTTFIKTLSTVFANLYERVPTAVEGAVDFIHVDKLARAVCVEAGESPMVATRDIEAAYAVAFKRVITPTSPLGQAGLSRRYLQDEVTRVIKGRGIDHRDTYRGIERTGRTTAFSGAMRDQAWELKEAWDEEMAGRGTVDFADVILRARDLARQREEPTYRSAIIDESQDLTLVGLQLVRALVNGSGRDRPDGMLIVGDGAQRIYPGGFTLRQAGIEVRGRSTVLRRNYRNTREILGAAQRIAGNESVIDLAENYQRAEEDAVADREGVKPVLVECTDRDDEVHFVASRIRDLVEHRQAVSLGDTALFVGTNDEAKRWTADLKAVGIDCQGLDKYEGIPTDAVKVGTYFRAKGLEFKLVFLPGLDAQHFPRPQQPGQDDAEYEDARSLQISQVFVAMTRARDGLFVLASDEPSELVVDALDCFDVIEA